MEVEGHALHIEAERHDDGTERLVGGMHVVERSFGKVRAAGSERAADSLLRVCCPEPLFAVRLAQLLSLGAREVSPYSNL